MNLPGHPSASQAPQQAPSELSTLVSVTSLFFMWGFITALNDILIPHLKAVFNLNYTQAMLVQFCFFGAYFLVSVPAGRLVESLGFKRGVSLGLTVAALGCLLFLPSAKFTTYGMFLLALFVLAAGITLLQVAANPLVTLLGSAQTASSRLNMTQAFNSLGTTVAPLFGAWLIFSGDSSSSDVDAVIVPYVAIALSLLIMAALFLKVRLPKHLEHNPEQKQNAEAHAPFVLFQHRRLLLGVIGIFVYVGAEVAIGSLLVNYLGLPQVMGFSESVAAGYIAYYWGGAMVGRFIGALLMQKIAAGKLLTINSIGSVLLIAISLSTTGAVSMWSILLVGLCNSIMFPTIFSLAIKELGPHTSRGSGLLCLAIVGGALIPLAQGIMADAMGLAISFVLPLLCYLYIAVFGVLAEKPYTATSLAKPEAVV